MHLYGAERMMFITHSKTIYHQRWLCVLYASQTYEGLPHKRIYMSGICLIYCKQLYPWTMFVSAFMLTAKLMYVCMLTEAKHLLAFAPVHVTQESDVAPGGHKYCPTWHVEAHCHMSAHICVSVAFLRIYVGVSWMQKHDYSRRQL
jgi:hypothetical protein